jgi:serine/threonine-protein kinase
MEFGIAKTADSVLKTRTGHMLGTPAYASPEQAMGVAVDARADQYSLGILLYRMLAGRLPFSADNVMLTLVLRLKDDPQPLAWHRPDLPGGITSAIDRALAREREQRWPSAGEMRQALVTACEAAGLDWDRPLPELAERGLTREALPPLSEHLPTLDGQYAMTADLPLPQPGPRRRSGPRWVVALIMGGAALGLTLWALRRPPTPPLAAPSLPQSVLPGPVPASSPAKAAPRPLRPEPRTTAPAPRRVVTYPQLQDTPSELKPVAGCAGLSVKVSLVVGEDGQVKTCTVLGNVKAECAQAARDLALRFRFKPGLDAEGRPIEASVATVVEFPES